LSLPLILRPSLSVLVVGLAALACPAAPAATNVPLALGAAPSWRVIQQQPVSAGAWRSIASPSAAAPAPATPVAQPSGGPSPWGAPTAPQPLETLADLPDPIEGPNQMLFPSLGGALPGAFGAAWGDYSIGFSAATPGKIRDNVDGSLNASVGFGDANKYVSIELDFGIGSIKRFAGNYGFSASISRMLVSSSRWQVAAGAGWSDFYSTGYEGRVPPNGYGVVTAATPLRPKNAAFQQVLQLSLGVGGNNFASMDENFTGPIFGYFGSIGVEVSPRLGVSAGVSGRGTNLELSYVPFSDLPISLGLVVGDVFNSSPWGTVGALTLSWGDNFRTGFFRR